MIDPEFGGSNHGAHSAAEPQPKRSAGLLTQSRWDETAVLASPHALGRAQSSASGKFARPDNNFRDSSTEHTEQKRDEPRTFPRQVSSGFKFATRQWRIPPCAPRSLNYRFKVDTLSCRFGQEWPLSSKGEPKERSRR
jgi:hypothetical protein